MKNKIIFALLIFAFVIAFVYFVRINKKGFDIKENSLGSRSQDSESLNSLGGNQDADKDDGEDNDGGDGGNTIQVNNTPKSITSIEKNKVSKTELSKHNKKSDCWVGYNGRVYDITTFLPNHPGSASAISPYCGTSDEFKKAFEKKHGTSKVSRLMRVGVFIGDFDIVGNI